MVEEKDLMRVRRALHEKIGDLDDNGIRKLSRFFENEDYWDVEEEGEDEILPHCPWLYEECDTTGEPSESLCQLCLLSRIYWQLAKRAT